MLVNPSAGVAEGHGNTPSIALSAEPPSTKPESRGYAPPASWRATPYEYRSRHESLKEPRVRSGIAPLDSPRHRPTSTCIVSELYSSELDLTQPDRRHSQNSSIGADLLRQMTEVKQEGFFPFGC